VDKKNLIAGTSLSIERPRGRITLAPVSRGIPTQIDTTAHDSFELFETAFALVRCAKIYSDKVHKIHAVLVETQLKDTTFKNRVERIDKYDSGCLFNNCNRLLMNMTQTPFCMQGYINFATLL